MRKPPRAFVIVVALLFLSGCFRVQAVALPEPAERGALDVRGVVLEGDERIEFARVDQTEWSDSTILLSGLLKSAGESGAPTATTRTIALSSVTALLVRQVDANRTSIIIGGIIVGGIAIAALALTGQADETTVLGTVGRD